MVTMFMDSPVQPAATCSPPHHRCELIMDMDHCELLQSAQLLPTIPTASSMFAAIFFLALGELSHQQKQNASPTIPSNEEEEEDMPPIAI